MAILVRPEKVTKSTQKSLKGCTFRLIAGIRLAVKKILQVDFFLLGIPIAPQQVNFAFKK